MALPESGIVIRPLREPDLRVAANIVAICADGDIAHQLVLLERRFARNEPDEVLFVAELDGRIAGIGRVSYFDPGEGAPNNAAPSGYYLLGVNVDPPCRRRGVGRALTEARLGWIQKRAPVAWYFTGASNEASIRLHQAFGFRRNTSDFWFPTVDFGASGGVLFSRALR